MSAHSTSTAVGLPRTASNSNLSTSVPAQAGPSSLLGPSVPTGIGMREADTNNNDVGLSAEEDAMVSKISVQHILALMDGDQRTVSILSADVLAFADGPNTSVTPFGTETVVVQGSDNATPTLSTHVKGCDNDVHHRVYKIIGEGCTGYVVIGHSRSGFATFKHSLNETAAKLSEAESKNGVAFLDLAVGEKYDRPKAVDLPKKYLHKLSPKRYDGVRVRDPGTVVSFDMDGLESLSARLDLSVTPYRIPDKFFQFKKLPKEVQAIIWNEAVEGRHLFACELTVPVMAPNTPINMPQTIKTHIFGGGIAGGKAMPAIAYVSKDVMSHLISRGKYERLLRTRCGGKGVYFNKEIDVVHLVPEQVCTRLGYPLYYKPSGTFRTSLVESDDAKLIKHIAFNLEVLEAFGTWSMDNIQALPAVEEITITGQMFASIREPFVMKLEFRGWCRQSYDVFYQTTDGRSLEGQDAINTAFEEMGDEMGKDRIRWLHRILESEYVRPSTKFPAGSAAVIHFLPLPYIPLPLR